MEANRIREVLRLKELGYNQTMIAASSGASRACVQDTLRRAQAVGLTGEEAKTLSDEELSSKLRKDGGHRQKIAVEIDYALLINLLRKRESPLSFYFVNW